MAVQQDFRVKKGLFVNESSNVVGNSAVGGNMTITGTIAVSNNTTMGGTLNVSRATTLSNTLAVVGTTTVTGATTLAKLNTTGAVSLANTLGVTGATTLSSTLLVQGASTVNNTLTVAGTLSTTGATTLSNTLSVAGATTLSNTLSTTGVATFANTLSAVGATTLSNTLSTSGAATFLNTLLVQGATTVNNNLVVANTLTVTRAATLANTLGVTGAATFANTLSVTGALTVGGNLTVSGSLTYVNTTALNIGDAVIALNADLGAVAPTENAGLEVNRGTSANSYIYWNETNDRWEATGNTSLTAANSEIHIGGTGPSNYTIDNSNGSVLQDVALTFDSFGHVRTVATTTANLDTRYLSFSSVVSGGVTVAADLYNDTLTLANGAGIAVSADATTDTITFSHYDTSSAASIAIDNSGGTVLQDVAVTLDAYGHVTAVSAASANLDTRYSQLSFSTLAVSGQSNVVADAIADTLTLAGNNGITITTDATTDTVTFTGPSKIPAWTTARTLTLGGDLTGNVTFDGSANFTLTAAVVDDSHNHIISNVDGLQTALDEKLGLATGGTFSANVIIADSLFILTDNTDTTKRVVFDLSGISTGTTRTITIPDTSSTLVDLATTQTISGTKTFSGSNQNFGSSTAAGTINLGYGATVSGATKTLNIGTGGVSGSTTNINLGATASAGLTTINSNTVINSTGYLQVASGTTAQRSAGANGHFRYNTTISAYEGYNAGVWVTFGEGARAGGAIYENANTIAQDYTITTGKNGLSAGPISVANGYTVTVPSGSTWVIV